MSRRWLLALVLAGCGGSVAQRSVPPEPPEEPADAAVTSALPDAPAKDRAPDPAPTGDAPIPDVAVPDAAAADGALRVEAGPAGAFENSLGMRFLPVPGLTVRFSIWETRVRDFEAYATATGVPVPHQDFAETALDPKAAVSRKEAEAFARWLTMKEQADGAIAAGQRYRLPADAEWDAAIELGKTGGPYPWGAAFPPPDHFANYGISQDGFPYTAPVGSFPPNRLGLHDLAGNLWEWIGEGCASGGAYLVRGAGWNAKNQSYFTSAFQYCFGADLVGHHNVGFRLVLEGGP